MGGESNKNADAASNQTGFKEGEGKDIGERFRADKGQSRTGCKGQTLRRSHGFSPNRPAPLPECFQIRRAAQARRMGAYRAWRPSAKIH